MLVTEGSNPTPIPYLTLYQHTTGRITMPDAATPYLYLLLEGSLRLYTPSGIMDYIPGQYSVSAIDTPTSGHILTFSNSNDFLALSISFSADDVIPIVLDMDGDLAERIMEDKLSTQSMENADANILDAVTRLLSIAEEPDQLAYMGKHIKREILFYALCGSCGKQFLQSMICIQQAGEIYEANTWIKENFKGTFTVEELAEQRNMSVSAFHQKFKSAVGMGPLQCQKRLRLTEARRLMLDESANVTDAAFEVGYESVSQFIRDYRKMFGQPPQKDIQVLRAYLQGNAHHSQ